MGTYNAQLQLQFITPIVGLLWTYLGDLGGLSVQLYLGF